MGFSGVAHILCGMYTHKYIHIYYSAYIYTYTHSVVYMFIYTYIYTYIYMYVCIYLSICLSVSLSICLYLSINLTTYLSVHLVFSFPSQEIPEPTSCPTMPSGPQRPPPLRRLRGRRRHAAALRHVYSRTPADSGQRLRVAV